MAVWLHQLQQQHVGLSPVLHATVFALLTVKQQIGCVLLYTAPARLLAGSATLQATSPLVCTTASQLHQPGSGIHPPSSPSWWG